MIPIVMTAYNRLDTLKQTLDSLFECDGIEGRDVIVYQDGGKDIEDAHKVFEVYQFLFWYRVEQLKVFSQPMISRSSNNKGLRGNSLQAINESLKKYDKIIFIQDDMKFSKSFLNWMDYALERYEDRKDIMFVTGYSHINYHCSYLSPLIADGLGIWKDKFTIKKKFTEVSKQFLAHYFFNWVDYKRFAEHTTRSFASHLKDILEKKSDAFMALLCYHMHIHNARCLHPGINKLRYMVSDSTNCKKKDSKKLNNVLYNESDLDESELPLSLLRKEKIYKWSILKRFTRWLSINLRG